MHKGYWDLVLVLDLDWVNVHGTLNGHYGLNLHGSGLDSVNLHLLVVLGLARFVLGLGEIALALGREHVVILEQSIPIGPLSVEGRGVVDLRAHEN